MIAEMPEMMPVQYGYDVDGIARSVAEAVAFGRQHQKPDLAIADLRCAHRMFGTEIAARLGGLGKVGILYRGADD